ncbi:MAG: hypothetical protein ABFR82_00345 [Nitrospirota bacterium]
MGLPLNEYVGGVPDEKICDLISSLTSDDGTASSEIDSTGKADNQKNRKKKT